jgi:cation transport protein ChaC
MACRGLLLSRKTKLRNDYAMEQRTPEQATGDLWVFAYGSLMWRPGFDYVERLPARVIGAHRSLCVLSHVHRGTPERPGLVLGLDRGGTCRGIAYRVMESQRAATVAYLREREQITKVYRECMRSVWLFSEPERQVEALCYMVDRGHPQYAGRMSLEEQLHHVRQGHGRAGPNRDYVVSTVKELEALGFRDAGLHLLAERLKGAHETPPAP